MCYCSFYLKMGCFNPTYLMKQSWNDSTDLMQFFHASQTVALDSLDKYTILSVSVIECTNNTAYNSLWDNIYDYMLG